MNVADFVENDQAQGLADTGHRLQQRILAAGDFFGLPLELLVLVLAAVNGFDIEGVGQDEGQAGGLSGIGQPIPAEHAFATDGQAVSVRLDQLEEELEVVVLDAGVDQYFTLPVHDADVHLARVQIDSAVVFGRGGVIFHSCIQSWVS